MRKITILAFFGLSMAFCLPSFAQTSALEQDGVASFYANKLNGRKTSNGERFSNKLLTAAHRSLPFGTILEVTNLVNNKVVFVRVNDRGPFSRGRMLDLSKKAAEELDFVRRGYTKVKIRVVGMAKNAKDFCNDMIDSLSVATKVDEECK